MLRPFIILSLLLPALRLAAAYGASQGLLLAEPLGVRPLGLAGVYSAAADDLMSPGSNPAGLARMEESRVFLGHGLGILGASMEQAAASLPLGHRWTLAAHAQYWWDSDVERDAWGREGASFSNSSLAPGLSLAGNLAPGWRVGASAKAAMDRWAGQESRALAADLGLQASLGGWDLGLAGLNLGSGSDASLPSRVSLGAARRFFSRAWLLAAEAQALPGERQIKAGLASELSLGLQGRGSFSLRAGVMAGLLEAEEPQPGFGFGLNLGGWDLDYAALPQALGVQHRFSLGLRFEGLKPQAAPGAELSAPFNLALTEELDGITLWWESAGDRPAGYNLYSDYGVLVDKLNPEPVQGTLQRFIRVTRSTTYNFYVRPVGGDGREGPASRVLSWRSR